MMNFILWDVSPEWFPIGPLTIRWYGLLFALGFLLGQQILIRIYKQEGKSEKDVETLTIYMVVATIIGARLGHVLFYDFDDYFRNGIDGIIEIFKIWNGGLASHGAAIGILIAIYLYSKKATHQSYFYVLDRMVITIALAGCLIRLGNLMNSEIIGTPTQSPTAFLFVNPAKQVLLEKNTNPSSIKEIDIRKNEEGIESFQLDTKLQGIDIIVHFKKNKIEKSQVIPFVKAAIDSSRNYQSVQENLIYSGDAATTVIENTDGSYSALVKAYAIPRHPSQLYEAISSFLLFVLLFFIYNRKKGETPEGRIFGLFVVILFSLRFIYEFNKEVQVQWESDMVSAIGINMGQLLSIPFVLAGLFILMRTFRKKNEIN